jgi:hypothetical protein
LLDQVTVDRIFQEIVRDIGLAFTLRALVITHPVIAVGLLAFVVLAAVLYYFLVLRPDNQFFEGLGSDAENGIFIQVIEDLMGAPDDFPATVDVTDPVPEATSREKQGIQASCARMCGSNQAAAYAERGGRVAPCDF